MLQCQNCGQVSAQRGNFCRFCGTKFLFEQASSKPDFEQSPPRPYSWKTDEFQVADAPRQKNRQPINQVQPLPTQQPFAAPPRPQPFVYQNQQQPQFQQQLPPHQQYQQQLQQSARPNMVYSPHCPRCASQYIRFEKKISTAGWIVFAVLMVTFFPLFWIGLLIKEDAQFCQVCNYKIA